MYFERITVWLGVTVDKDQNVQEFPLVCQCRQVYLFQTFEVRVVCGVTVCPASWSTCESFPEELSFS